MNLGDQPKARIAPTPSGFLHLGNAFNFITTALLADESGADLLLRIDDLDQARYRQEYAEDIFRCLNYLEIQYQEGPESVTEFEASWSQTHRVHQYIDTLSQLKEAGKLYACNCSRKRLAENREGGILYDPCLKDEIPLDTPHTSWRLISPEPHKVSMSLWRAGQVGEYSLTPEMINMVVRRKDGLPAYQLASLVDDLHFGVGLVVRGEDLLPSSVAQLYLAKQLGNERFESVLFYHHPLQKEKSGEKLSKSVLKSREPLTQKYKSHEIYRLYCHFLGLDQEYGSLSELKDANLTGVLKAHSVVRPSAS